jgi:predicted phage-related endonuclease
MPDPAKQSISASQAAALFDRHPYYTKWMLWQHFRRGLSIEAEAEERIAWGRLLQDDILTAVAIEYRLDVVPNHGDEYIRDGLLGATIDAHMIAPEKGEIVVEAKNIDWLRWRDTWSETAAAPHVEIQLQTQMRVRKAQHGLIAALVGGNDLRFYERERNSDLWELLEQETRLFFESLKTDREPDPLGSPLELPMLARLYPETVPTKTLQDLEDEDLAETIRQFNWARNQESFAKKFKEQMQAKLLARAGDFGIIRANGVSAFIKKSPTAAQLCAPHADPKVLRKASILTRIQVEEAERVPAGELEGIAP